MFSESELPPGVIVRPVNDTHTIQYEVVMGGTPVFASKAYTKPSDECFQTDIARTLAREQVDVWLKHNM